MTKAAIKSLADGQLAATKTTLYTASDDPATQAIVKSIKFANTNSADVSVIFYFKASGGTSRRIVKAVLGDEGWGVDEDETTLEAGDIIEGIASIADVVDYVLSGIQNS